MLVYAGFFIAVRRFGPGLWLCVAAVLAAGLVAVLFRNFWHADSVTHCTLYFFLGGIFQRLLGRMNAKLRRLAFLASAAICATLIATWDWPANPFYDPVAGHPQPVLLLFFPCLIAAFVTVDDVIGKDALARVAWLGNLTYSSYLLHFPIQLAVVLMLDRAGIGRDVFYHPAALVAFLSATFLAAFWVHRLFEMPAQARLRSLLAPRVALPRITTN